MVYPEILVGIKFGNLVIIVPLLLVKFGVEMHMYVLCNATVILTDFNLAVYFKIAKFNSLPNFPDCQ